MREFRWKLANTLTTWDCHVKLIPASVVNCHTASPVLSLVWLGVTDVCVHVKEYRSCRF